MEAGACSEGPTLPCTVVTLWSGRAGGTGGAGSTSEGQVYLTAGNEQLLTAWSSARTAKG